MEGNLSRNIETMLPFVGHVQIAQVICVFMFLGIFSTLPCHESLNIPYTLQEVKCQIHFYLITFIFQVPSRGEPNTAGDRLLGTVEYLGKPK